MEIKATMVCSWRWSGNDNCSYFSMRGVQGVRTRRSIVLGAALFWLMCDYGQQKLCILTLNSQQHQISYMVIGHGRNNSTCLAWLGQPCPMLVNKASRSYTNFDWWCLLTTNKSRQPSHGHPSRKSLQSAISWKRNRSRTIAVVKMDSTDWLFFLLILTKLSTLKPVPVHESMPEWNQTVEAPLRGFIGWSTLQMAVAAGQSKCH